MIKKIKKKIKKVNKCREYIQSVSMAAIMGLFIVIRANKDAKKGDKKNS
jgi:hypothetical protein